MKRKKLSLVFSLFILLALAAWLFSSIASGNSSLFPGLKRSARVSRAQQALAGSMGEIRVHAAGRGTPWVSLSDGIEVQAEYQGLEGAAQSFAASGARSLSLASADFDEDGVPDLVTGAASDSAGIVTLYRGNRDSLDPNSPIARRRKASGEFLDSPFLTTASVFDLPATPGFLAAGDFDNDGHVDLVAAARGSDALCLLRGDGRGSFKEAEMIAVPGSITAVVSGEINRADGLADLVVGIENEAGNEVLVFESPEGALRGEPEAIPVSGRVNGLALGQLDDQFEMDLAVAAGHNVILVHGRDRKLSLGKERQPVTTPLVESVSLPFDVTSIALGDFRGRRLTDIAVLTADGAITLLDHPGRRLAMSRSDSGASASAASLRKWKKETLSKEYWPQATALLSTKVSSIAGDDLLIVDPARSSLHIVTNTPASAGENATQLQSVSPRPDPITLDTDSAPVAVLPMRLNNDALEDLVILRSDRGAPAVAVNVVVNTFVVTNTNDAGTGTLRQAILDANRSPGEDAIKFNIGATGSFSIAPLSPLPPITEAVTIDGFSQQTVFAGPVIEIKGLNAGTNTSGLTLDAAGCAIKGLVINGFSQQGVLIMGSGGCAVEGCRIGTDISGTQAQPNGVGGVLINGSPNNTIGSTAQGAGNVISGNTTTGILISNNGAAGNIVEGNFIGTNADGTLPVPNTLTGVTMDNTAMNNRIGGAATGAANVISGNGSSGISLSAGAAGNLIQGNRLGTAADGNSALNNRFDGVLIQGTANNTIGGAGTGAGNVISANSGSGVQVSGNTATSNLIQGNLIGLRADGVSALPNNVRGVFLDGGNNNLVGGAASGAANKIAFHPLEGILGFAGTGNTISQNSIASNDGLGIDLLPQGVTPNDPEDADTGPNNLQNFPSLTSAIASGGAVAIRGKLDSAPQTPYTIEFFRNAACDALGNGEGQDFIGQTVVTTDNAGAATFNVTFAVAVNVGNIITATATNNNTSDTSEFSQCAAVTDPPVLNIGDATVTEGNAGPTEAVFAVTLSFQSAQTVTVQFATQDNTAQAPADYVSTTGTLTFSPGTTTQNITVQVNGDNLNEANETFFVNLSNPVNAVIADGQAVGTILDNDPLPGVSINNSSVLEGNSGTTNLSFFTVQLTQASGKTVTVDFATADGTATAGSDYVPASGRLTFAAGETTKFVSNAIIGDTLVEPNETFFVNLSNPVNVTIQQGQGIGTIFNDDLPPAGTLQFSSSAFSVTENGASAVITVTRAGQSSGAVSVNFSTSNGTATAGADYTATSGTLNFASGQTGATFDVPIIDDSLVEGAETINLTLSSATGGAMLGSPSTAVLTISDNDVPQHGALQFSAANYRASETAGNAVITVLRTSGSEGPVSVNFDISNGTATAGSDYTSTSGTLSFGDGETSKTFSVTILNDTIVEGDETVNLALTNPTGGATLGSPATATLTILDDETRTPEVAGITPNLGDPAGGDFVTISGRNFEAGATVRFGNNLASNVTVAGDSAITCTSPPGTGTVNVSITTSRGVATLGNAFTYVAGAVPGTQLDWFSPNAVNAAPAAQLDPPRDLSASRVTTTVPAAGRSPHPSVAGTSGPQVSTPNLLGYNVYRSSDPLFQVTDAGAQRIANLPAGVTDYFDPDIAQTGAQIAASTTPVFFYRVTAVYEQGESLPTQTASTGVVITGVSLRQTAGRTTLVVQGVSLATFRAQLRVTIGTVVTTIRKTRFPKEGRLGNGTSSVIEVDIPPIPAGACLLTIEVINPGRNKNLSDAQFSPPFLFSLGCVP